MKKLISLNNSKIEGIERKFIKSKKVGTRYKVYLSKLNSEYYVLADSGDDYFAMKFSKLEIAIKKYNLLKNNKIIWNLIK